MIPDPSTNYFRVGKKSFLAGFAGGGKPLETSPLTPPPDLLVCGVAFGGTGRMAPDHETILFQLSPLGARFRQ